MKSNLKLVTQSEIDSFVRYLTVFTILTRFLILAFIIFYWIFYIKAFHIIPLLVSIYLLVRFVNSIIWLNKAKQQLKSKRPLKTKVYLKKLYWSPFAPIIVSLFDARGFNAFNSFGKPVWKVLGATWNVKSIMGEAQDCLVYVDNDTNRVYAFKFEQGVVFTKPSMNPWCKLDAAKLITDRKANYLELTETIDN